MGFAFSLTACSGRVPPTAVPEPEPVPCSPSPALGARDAGAEIVDAGKLDDPTVTGVYDPWRSAIETYVPSVTAGNLTALDSAAVPFADYLRQMHNRIHPIFSNTFLAALQLLPASDPLNRPELFTRLELGIDHETGRILRLGVVHSSGIRAFDVAALESVHRAQPFGPAPPEIVSPDGSVYVRWEFHRNVAACGTAYAHPYLLKSPP